MSDLCRFLLLFFLMYLSSRSEACLLTITTTLMPRYLELSNGERIAHHSTKGSVSPGVVCLHGFRSEMVGRKAVALEQHCQQVNRPFVRFDYRGHGESSGDFMDLTLTDWIQDALHGLDELTSDPQILVGSSMGAWMALHVALKRPNRVAGIVCVAAAPDFTRDIYKELSETEKHALKSAGVYYRPSIYSNEPYPITLQLLDDAEQWCLLDKSIIPIKCPVHLIHGEKDKDISFQKSVALAKLLESSNVQVTLIKDGNHRLSETSDLECIASTVEEISMLYKIP